jgi:hypothetical protein
VSAKSAKKPSRLKLKKCASEYLSGQSHFVLFIEIVITRQQINFERLTNQSIEPALNAKKRS